MSYEKKQHAQQQNPSHKQEPEYGLMEKSCALAAVRGVVLRTVRLGVVLFPLLSLRYARAVAVAFFSCANRLDTALGLPSVYFGAVVLRLLAGQLGKNSLLTPAVAGTAFLLPVLQKCVGAR